MERLDCGLVELRAAPDAGPEAMTFSGYGAVFGNVDAYGDVIAKGAFDRSIADWSLVATTNMERASPASPKSFWTNSKTSRPRSPTRAITLMSAFTFFAIMPSSVLLPTPLPANIPTLCPLPMESVPSMAFMPKSIRSLIGGRERGLMYGFSMEKNWSGLKPESPSIGLPSASMILPFRKSPTGILSCCLVLRTKFPAASPVILS